MNLLKIAVVGCGVIGNALINWLEKNSPKTKILKIDPYKNYNDDINEADAIFISIHIPTEDNGEQNLNVLKEIIKSSPNVPIFIRTTLLPGTCDKLSKEFNKRIYFMPEFLTQRTAEKDFNTQPIIFTGEVELLKQIFKNKKYITMTNLEAEITKYTHNVFGALKVTYFNGIYEYCKQNNADFEKVREGCLLSGYINSPHTFVPGPDGKFGYGGKCFPKDVNAFAEALKETQLKKLIQDIVLLNDIYRRS